MRWMGAAVGCLALGVFVGGCTTATVESAPSTSISLGAPEVAERGDAVLRYGLPTSPSDPWAHYRTGCDTSCGIVFGAITDTLFATSIDGATVGLLVEDAGSNNDHTVHTWSLRSGITFSDGTPFDAAAAKVNIDACRHSALTGPGLAGIDDVRAEGQTLTITTLAPWATLPVHFAETPCGHMFSGAWLRSLPDLPMRLEGAPFFDEAIAALTPVGDPERPVGLGGFTMTAFEQGSGNSTVLEPTESYWRGSEGITGEGLSPSATIELVVIGDDATRRAGLETGQFDLILSSDPTEIERIAELGPSVRSDAFSDIAHLAYNAVNEEPNPLRWVSCRRAIDRSIDVTALSNTLGQRASSGPIDWKAGEGALSPDENPVAAPGPFDPAPASQWAERCVEDHGGPLDLRLAVAAGDDRAAIVAGMIESATNHEGLDADRVSVTVVEMEIGDLAVAVLLGEFDLVLWEGFSGVHPDLHFRWWFSEASAPVGAIATNVSRIDDPALDRALVQLRRADDAEQVRDRSNDASTAFRSGAWSTWLTQVEWSIGFDDRVDLDLTRATPEGIELVPIVNGVHSLQRITGS